MTNKVQKIREKVERLIEQTKPYLGACAGQVVAEANNKIAAYNEVLAILDTMQEEPKSKFEQSIQEGDNIVYNEDLGCRVNLSQLDRVAKKEEPVSNPIDFEQELYKAFGQVKDFTLGMRIAKWFYDMGKNSQEPISEEFEKALAEEWQGYVDRGAATVDALEDNTQELAFAKGFYRGANWQKEQMIAKAVDATVHIDAGGYPYIPQMELYDYDKDIPLAKEGDKYKVILIKEG